MIFTAVIALGALAYYTFEHSSAFLLSFAWAVPVMLLVGGLGICSNDSFIVNYFFANSYIVFIGEISFEFFLFHQLIIRYLNFINKYIHFGNCIYIGAFGLTVYVSYYVHNNFDSILKRISQ